MLPSLELGTLTAPLGAAGVTLPAAIAVAMMANIDLGFGRAAPQGSKGDSVLLCVMEGTGSSEDDHDSVWNVEEIMVNGTGVGHAVGPAHWR